MSLMPAKMPPAWSCQPPPVVSICSRARVRAKRTFRSQPKPHKSLRAARTVAAKMLLVPRPEPLGAAATRESSMPPPNLANWAARVANPPPEWKRGRNPARAKAALARANGLPGWAKVSKSA